METNPSRASSSYGCTHGGIEDDNLPKKNRVRDVT